MEFVWGRPCGKHLPSKPGDHFMLGRKCTVVNAFPCIMAKGQMHLHKVSLHKLAYETISCFLQGTFCSKLTRKLCLGKCLQNTLCMFHKVIMEVKGFHALLKNWKNLTLIVRCNIRIFYKRHIHGYKVPLESIFFSEWIFTFFSDLKHMILTHSKGFCEKNCPKFARFQF
jgi:hypothetical protein